MSENPSEPSRDTGRPHRIPTKRLSAMEEAADPPATREIDQEHREAQETGAIFDATWPNHDALPMDDPGRPPESLPPSTSLQ
jgi:hypothetical protein